MFDICLVSSSGSNWEQQWSFVLSNFGPRHLYVIGEVDTRIIPFRKVVQVRTTEEIPTDLILLSPINARYYPGFTSLIDFNHPQECCYIFGSDNLPVSEDQLGQSFLDDIVYIPTQTGDSMYSFMAGAITLYDRMIKNGQPDH